MDNSNIGAASLALIGIVGTFASLITMPAGPWRTALIAAFLMLIILGLSAWVSYKLDFANAWPILKECRRLGIRRIYRLGTASSQRKQMSKAIKIRIMAVSGNTLIKTWEPEIIDALANRRANVQVLLATADSEFVKDIEEAESPHRAGQISSEIHSVEKMLSEYVDKACEKKSAGEIGRIQLANYSTHLRSCLIICDDNWGWMTPILSPKRAVHTLSFELGHREGGLLNDCIIHFDRCWQIAESRGHVRQLGYPNTSV